MAIRGASAVTVMVTVIITSVDVRKYRQIERWLSKL
jgi:hypothetical protein